MSTPEGFNELPIDWSWTAGGAGDVVYLSIASGNNEGTRYLWIGEFVS